MAQPGLIDFSILGDLPDVYAKGQERRQKDLFEQSLKGFTGDYNDLVRRAAAAGYTPGLELASKLKQAEATNQYHLGTLAQRKHEFDVTSEQAMKPEVHWNQPGPFDPPGTMTGVETVRDKNGAIRSQSTVRVDASGNIIRGGAGAPPPPQQQPQQPGPAEYWRNIPTQGPGMGGVGSLGPRSDLGPEPGGPAYAQAAPGGFPDIPQSAGDQLITQAQQAMQPPGPQGPPLAQFAQAGGPPVPPPQAPQPAPAVPSWMAGAQAPAVTLPQQGRQQEAANPLGREQRGTLRYTNPLGPFNEDIIAPYPKEAQALVRGLATGRIDPRSIRAKDRAAYEGLAQLYSGTGYSETLYGQRQRTINVFAGGIQGRNLTAINNLTDHLDTARHLISALENGQVPAINAAINKFREVTGYKAELPGNLKAAAPIITGELLKVIAGVGGGGVGERAENELRMFSANANPKVAYGAIDTAQRLMGGQMRGLEQFYENNTYNTDFRQKLSPTARKIMDQLDAAHGAPEAGPAATPAPQRTKTGVPYTIEP